MTTIYAAQLDEIAYFSNKADAFKAARDHANYSGYEVEVLKCVVAPMDKREMILKCLSGGGWCSEQTTIVTIKPNLKAK